MFDSSLKFQSGVEDLLKFSSPGDGIKNTESSK